jgi:hypothetical protein
MLEAGDFKFQIPDSKKESEQRTVALAMSVQNGKIQTQYREAEVIGALAIFRDGEAWNLTHVPTGRMIFTCRSEANARLAAYYLQDGMDWTWGVFGQIDCDHPEHWKRANQAFQNFC